MDTIKTVIDGVEFSIRAEEVTGAASYFSERWQRISNDEAARASVADMVYDHDEAAYYRPLFTTVSAEADKLAASGLRYTHSVAVARLAETLDGDRQIQRYRLLVCGKVGGVKVMDWTHCGEPFEWVWCKTTTLQDKALIAWDLSGASDAVKQFRDRVEAVSAAIYQYLNGEE